MLGGVSSGWLKPRKYLHSLGSALNCAQKVIHLIQGLSTSNPWLSISVGQLPRSGAAYGTVTSGSRVSRVASRLSQMVSLGDPLPDEVKRKIGMSN